MRIHTDRIRANMVLDALSAERRAGRIASHVTYKELLEHGSRKRDRGIEIQLEAIERDRGRRVGNSGSYGAMNDGSYAATHDEWGWLLAALFELDPDMVVGSPTHPMYDGRLDFHKATGHTYQAGLAEWIEKNGDPANFRAGRNLIGRRGSGRSLGVQYDGLAGRSSVKDDPRTAEWARDFYAGRVF